MTKGVPQLWDPVTANTRALPEFSRQENTTSLPLDFEPHQSFFIIFPHDGSSKDVSALPGGKNFIKTNPVTTLDGPWKVSFDPEWGGPESVLFETLQDWTSAVNVA